MTAFRLVALSCLTAAAVWAASSVTGVWEGQVQMRNGNTLTVHLDLKASDDGGLTGTVTGRGRPVQIADGKVQGNNITFNVVREFTGTQIKQHYDGTLDGDTIHFNVTTEGGPASGVTRAFDAKRVRR
jgi:hypothetical protein